MPTTVRKFGRKVVLDERDANFLLREIMPKSKPLPTRPRYWPDTRYFGDQKSTPHCVGFAFCHWIEDGPAYPPPGSKVPLIGGSVIYFEAQKNDDIPGEDYEGTTVRGGAQALRKKFLKIKSFRWAKTVNEIAYAVAVEGPVVAGTDWHEDMMDVDSQGFIRPGGEVLGGHAYLLNGVNVKEKFFRVKNSWGRDWGTKGRAKISFDDLEKLISTNGEFCLAIER